jgi:RNA polymerase sigma factor
MAGGAEVTVKNFPTLIHDDLPITVEDRVLLIQQGDESMRSDLINDSQPFIRSIVGRMLHTSTAQQHDEYSIALSAFSDAINKYDSGSGVPFFKFAGIVINRKLIDWLRSQKKHNENTVNFSSFEQDTESNFVGSIEDTGACSFTTGLEIEEELLLLRDRLIGFGLNFAKVTKKFPKKRASRKMCVSLANLLVNNEPLYRGFEIKKKLPMAELSRLSRTSIKTIERNRSSIILLSLLLTSDLEVIKHNLAVFLKEE